MPHPSPSRVTNTTVPFSETLDQRLSDVGKMEEMDREIVKLNETIVFFKMMVQLKDEGTTKRGRVDTNISNNKVLVSAIRDVMNSKILPYCKFLGKKDLQTIAEGSVAEVVLDALGVGTVSGNQIGRVNNYRERLGWWIRNVELVERQLIEHRTKVTQAMKNKYIQGMYRYDDIVCFFWKRVCC